MLAKVESRCPVLDEMLRTDQTVGRSGKVFKGLAAASTANNLAFIRKVMADIKPTRTLEIGLSYGASTLTFCSEHKHLDRNGTKQHVALDPYQPYAMYDECGVFAVERAGLGDYLDPLFEFSEFALPRLLENHRQFDFIYVDGSHVFENVFIDAFYCARLLADDGIVAFDDSTDPHVAKVIAFIRSNLGGQLPEVHHGAAGLKSRIGKALGRNQLTAFRRLRHFDQHGVRKWDTPLRAWDAPFKRF
jgi:hypothetical protein